MSKPVIKIQKLGKMYNLDINSTNQTLSEVITNFFKPSSSNFSGISKKSSIEKKQFWALNDINLEVTEGEILGIIGRNGAGKSTLLKILSRITAPTTGNVIIRGKIGSLLEVGTGFHPELTGKENIYLNGSILGMKKSDINQKFEDIVKFSGVELFLDTPVKRYSSGMYVRLAFAVASHLETEILIVDEVLAVGDLEFQKKCLGKMQNIVNEGRSVLFVSHNIGAISHLTNTCLWLDQGRIKQIGSTLDVISSYLSEGYSRKTVWEVQQENRNPIQIVYAQISSEGDFFTVDKDINILIRYKVREILYGAVVSVIIHSSDGASIISTEDIDCHPELINVKNPGYFQATIKIPRNWLSSGKYYVRLHSGIVFQTIFDNIEALNFELIETGNPKIRAHRQAYLLPYLNWDIDSIA